MHLHAEVREVVLEQRGHLHTLRVRRTGGDGKFHWLATVVDQLTGCVPGESR